MGPHQARLHRVERTVIHRFAPGVDVCTRCARPIIDIAYHGGNDCPGFPERTPRSPTFVEILRKIMPGWQRRPHANDNRSA